jgi:SAM-dependent methyltransferase
MHQQARHFLQYCARTFADLIKGDVLDVGSGDINGNNRIYFPSTRCRYVGCDVVPGRNVDIVSPCHELAFDDETFDVIISTECLEHDMHFAKSVEKMMAMLKPGGLLIITCATTGRAEHGTRRTSSNESLSVQLGGEWADYYRNVTFDDLKDIIVPHVYCRAHVNLASKDLYVVAIKGGDGVRFDQEVPQYNA